MSVRIRCSCRLFIAKLKQTENTTIFQQPRYLCYKYLRKQIQRLLCSSLPAKIPIEDIVPFPRIAIMDFQEIDVNCCLCKQMFELDRFLENYEITIYRSYHKIPSVMYIQLDVENVV